MNPKDAWEVLVLFLVPWGGGIPAGVLLAQSRGIAWPMMTLLYFISDVILACAFEPMLKGMIKVGRKFPRMAKFNAALKKAVMKSTSYYGTGAGPLALILIAFGADPMTGRAATVAAGHRFLSGWTLAIIGDMMYYALIMASTLWLQSVLGDGKTTMMVVLIAMIVVPYVVRRVRALLQPTKRA